MSRITTAKEKKTDVDREKVRDVSGNIIERVFSPSTEQSRSSTESEDVAMIIREWLAMGHIKTKTRYSKRQVIAVSILQSLATTYKIKTLDRFLREFRTCKLSEEGKSSEELVNILKSRLPADEDIELKKLSKFLE